MFLNLKMVSPNYSPINRDFNRDFIIDFFTPDTGPELKFEH